MAKADALRIIRENIKKHKRGEDARVLDLGNCGLTEFPEEALECVWVEELILSSEWSEYDLKNMEWKEKHSQNKGEVNKINLFPRLLSQMKLIKKIIMAAMPVRDLLPLSNLVNLRKLNLNSTPVSNLWPLAGLINLQYLDCNSTQINDLTPLSGLANLKYLDCDSTAISDLSSLSDHISLQHFSCSFTYVRSLASLARLANLQHLSCSNTHVANLNPLTELTNLQFLGFSHTQVADLTPLVTLTNLQWLLCSRTEIADLTPLAKLTKLSGLLCSHTKVKDLSPLVNLITLKRLDFDKTQVADLTPLAGLTNLLRISFSNTHIDDLTPLSNLTNLVLLFCSDTQITNLNPLASLTNLKLLYCYSTQISDLTPLAGLLNLQQLYCDSTQISDLTPILHLIEKGVEVKWQDFSEHYNEDTATWQERHAILVKDCPLTHPPVEIVKQGNEAILRYFEDLETQGEEIVYEAKMLILGDAGAGKTSLARKIEDPDANMPDEEKDSTPGIAVRALTLSERQPDFTMHLWDFGGQEVYHATHQFFLSKRSLYVLLSDGRKEEQLDYWLQMQEIYGQDSRLLLVVNQKGDMQPNLPMSDIRRDYPNVQEAQPTVINLKTDREGAVALRQRIEQQIRNLPQFEQGLRTPKKWAAIRQKLEGLDADHIDIKAYRQLCEEEGITDPNRKKDLLDFLHNLGAVLHFQDVAGLNKMVILRPEWATNAVYRLLDHTKKKGDNGHFTRQDLDAVWQCAEYEDYFEELLGLMDKFELCYPAPEDKNLFIVPSLLPDTRSANSDWPVDAADMQLWYEYSFMPKGIVTRLIVRQHQLLESPPTVWKRGAIFAIENARAEVTESFREKRISIRASGKQAKALLTILAREIDTLNSGFHFNERMTLKQIVPCHCPQCKKLSKPHPFDYKTLANRLERGRLTIDCEASLDEISIPDLLRETFSDADKILKTFERREEMGRFGRRGAGEALTRSQRLTPAKPAPLKIFISYSKHDRENFLIPMTRFLNPLMRAGLIETWNDHDIQPGEEWDEAIKSEIEKADVIFLLVSAHSLNTDYIWNVEIEAAMRRHEAGTVHVIPIILSTCLWQEKDQGDNYIFPPAKLNTLPSKGKPINKWSDQDEAWHAVAEGVKKLLKRP